MYSNLKRCVEEFILFSAFPGLCYTVNPLSNDTVCSKLSLTLK